MKIVRIHTLFILSVIISHSLIAQQTENPMVSGILFDYNQEQTLILSLDMEKEYKALEELINWINRSIK